MIEKPPAGDPCNGCGLCCRVRICALGSFALRLVERYGDRVDGPCPALQEDGSRQVCGLMREPKRFLPGNPRSVTALRNAVGLLIGAGAGCDDAGDEPEEVAGPIIDALVRRHLARAGKEEFNRALRLVCLGR